MTDSFKALERPTRAAAFTQEIINLHRAPKQQAQIPESSPQPEAEPEAPELQPQNQLQQPPPQEPQQPKQPQQQKQLEKPRVIKPKQLTLLECASNTTGEIFHSGDQILVSAPWGGRVKAEIVGLYADNSGRAWVRYKPIEVREGWPWEGGCLRAERMIKA